MVRSYPAMSRGYYHGTTTNNAWSNDRAWMEAVNVESRVAREHRYKHSFELFLAWGLDFARMSPSIVFHIIYDGVAIHFSCLMHLECILSTQCSERLPFGPRHPHSW